MGKTRVKFAGPLGQLQKDGIPTRFKKEMAEDTIDEMKRLITRGQSPVKGFGRFDAYVAQREPEVNIKILARKKYPYGVREEFPGKKVRPVNLTLTGEMLDALTYKRVGKNIRIGYFRGLFGFGSKELVEKVSNAQRGNPEKNIPQRKFLPTDGEGFVQSVMRVIKNSLLKALKTKLR